MKSRMLNRIISILFLLLTFYFSLLTSVESAGYPTLLKNGFIDEVDTGGSQGKTKQDDKVSENKHPFDKLGFHISASLGFCELFHSGDDGDMHKPGFTYKFSGDYWFGDHFGLGIELQFLNLFGSHSNGDFILSNYDEFNYYVSPYIKVGLFTTQNQRLFVNFGFGYGEPRYGKEMGDGPYPNSKRILVKFDLGWGIKIGKNYEAGILIDNKLMEAGSSGGEYGGSALFLLSVSPFIGYVF